MQIASLPTKTSIVHRISRDEHDIAVAQLLMDDPGDNGLSSGFYWAKLPPGATEADLVSKDRWVHAVRREQGPFRRPAAAIIGAEKATAMRYAIAAVLRQAAELVLSGEIEDDVEAIAGGIANHEWIAAAHEGRMPPPPPGPDTTETPSHEERAGAFAEAMRASETGDRPEAEDGEAVIAD